MDSVLKRLNGKLIRLISLLSFESQFDMNKREIRK